jgi:hypothetical protein
MNIPYSIPLEIQKVLQLEGASDFDLRCSALIYAYVAKPVKDKGSEVTYVLLSRYESNGMARLGGD